MKNNLISYCTCLLIQVDGEKSFQRVSGTNLGGGTYLGLGRLLTKCNRSLFCTCILSKKNHNLSYCWSYSFFTMLIYFLFSFDELLELSKQGDNTGVDMLVGDIYGGMDYSKVYL